MRFAIKQLESNLLIEKGFILVNGVLKTKNYLARINDIIKKTIVLPFIVGSKPVVQSLSQRIKKSRKKLCKKYPKKSKWRRFKRKGLLKRAKRRY